MPQRLHGLAWQILQRLCARAVQTATPTCVCSKSPAVPWPCTTSAAWYVSSLIRQQGLGPMQVAIHEADATS